MRLRLFCCTILYRACVCGCSLHLSLWLPNALRTFPFFSVSVPTNVLSHNGTSHSPLHMLASVLLSRLCAPLYTFLHWMSESGIVLLCAFSILRTAVYTILFSSAFDTPYTFRTLPAHISDVHLGTLADYIYFFSSVNIFCLVYTWYTDTYHIIV